VVALEANQTFVLGARANTTAWRWDCTLSTLNDTRLVRRIHLGPYQLGVSVDPDATPYGSSGLCGGAAEPARNQSSGRRQASERTVYAELLLWVACFVVFVAAEIVLLVMKGLLQPLLAAAGTGLMTAWPVLVQLPLWITVIGTRTSLALLWWAFRADSQPAPEKLEPQAA
jgi:hypothetical protein